MKLRICSAATLTCGVLVITGAARAQLVFGTTTTTTTNGAAFYMDVTTQQVTTLWNSAANKKVNGITGDAAHSRIYANDAARLNFWDYGSIGTAPTFIAGTYRTDGSTFSATGVDGLCWANGNLYGTTSTGSATFGGRGIYQIATVSDGMPTPHCVMTPLWTVAINTNVVFGDVEFNPADNKFYVVNSAPLADPWTPGLYSIDAFGTGTATRVADLPAGVTNVDGLAIGGGQFWMTRQDPTNSRINIYPWDPATQTYGATLFVPLTDGTQRASDAAWIPGALPAPGSFGLLTLAGLAAARRRRC